MGPFQQELPQDTDVCSGIISCLTERPARGRVEPGGPEALSADMASASRRKSGPWGTRGSHGKVKLQAKRREVNPPPWDPLSGTRSTVPSKWVLFAVRSKQDSPAVTLQTSLLVALWPWMRRGPASKRKATGCCPCRGVRPPDSPTAHLWPMSSPDVADNQNRAPGLS